MEITGPGSAEQSYMFPDSPLVTAEKIRNDLEKFQSDLDTLQNIRFSSDPIRFLVQDHPDLISNLIQDVGLIGGDFRNFPSGVSANVKTELSKIKDLDFEKPGGGTLNFDTVISTLGNPAAFPADKDAALNWLLPQTKEGGIIPAFGSAITHALEFLPAS